MPAKLHVVCLPALPEGDQSFDVQELASQASVVLEAYRRAPWTGINDQTRMAKLRLARQLIERIERLETGRITMRTLGD